MIGKLMVYKVWRTIGKRCYHNWIDSLVNKDRMVCVKCGKLRPKPEKKGD